MKNYFAEVHESGVDTRCAEALCRVMPGGARSDVHLITIGPTRGCWRSEKDHERLYHVFER
jgi:hypothetical protein